MPSTVVVIAIALVLGIALSRPAVGHIRTGTLAFGGFMHALPAYGVIILLVFILGFGTTTAITALVLASFLPESFERHGVDAVNADVAQMGDGWTIGEKVGQTGRDEGVGVVAGAVD